MSVSKSQNLDEIIKPLIVDFVGRADERKEMLKNLNEDKNLN